MSAKDLPVTVSGGVVHIGPDFQFAIHRTLRVPDDGKTYPLPASLGTFPIYQVDDYRDTVPKSWLKHGGVFIPMWQREAAWLSFHGAATRPVAALIAAGKVCAITGKRWDGKLHTGPQNYVVVGGPLSQPWLDGFKTKDGRVSQFVAMPLGQGYTVEKQITGEESFGGFQLQVFPSKTERHLPETAIRHRGVSSPHESPTIYGGLGGGVLSSVVPPRPAIYSMHVSSAQKLNATSRSTEKAAEMGLGAGGAIRQKIYEAGEWTPDAFDLAASGRIFVHIVNSQMFAQITGKEPPTSPITRATYEGQNYPWFDLYDENLADTPVSDALAGVKTVTAIDDEKGFEGQMDNTSIDPKHVIKYGDPNQVRDGDW